MTFLNDLLMRQIFFSVITSYNKNEQGKIVISDDFWLNWVKVGMNKYAIVIKVRKFQKQIALSSYPSRYERSLILNSFDPLYYRL